MSETGALVVQILGQPAFVGTAEFRVGRRANPRMICTLTVDDEYASSPHARFFPQDGTWFVEDLGSTNGIYVNVMASRRVYGPQRLAEGDRVQVGRTILTVVPT